MKINRDLMMSHLEMYHTHSDKSREHLRLSIEAMKAHNYPERQAHWEAYKAERKAANKHRGIYNTMLTKLCKAIERT